MTVSNHFSNKGKALKTLRPGKEQMLAWQEQFGGIKSFKIQVFLRKQIKRINYNARKALREASSSTAPSDSPSPDDAIGMSSSPQLQCWFTD